MFGKLVDGVKRALSRLQPNSSGEGSQKAQQDPWLDQISDFHWVEDESDRLIPAEGKKGWMEGIFGSTRPLGAEELGVNMSDSTMGPSEEEATRPTNSGQKVLMV